MSAWSSKQYRETDEQLRKRKYFWKLKECGSLFVKGTSLTDYKLLTRRCRSALCCHCSRLWSVALSNSLIKTIPNAKHKDMKFITVGIGLTTSIEGAYYMFGRWKTELRDDIYKLRRSRKSKLRPWRAFGLAVSLEIDAFRSEDFRSLGLKKQQQYTAMGYKPDEMPDGINVWIATAHGVIYRGRLPLKDFSALASKNAHYVHFTELYSHQNVFTAIRRVLKYASKVRYTTTLQKNMKKVWSLEQISAYCEVVSRGKGRQSYRFVLKSKR